MSYHGIIGYHIPDFFEKLAAIWNSIQGHSDLPAIAASGSNVYVVWFDNTPGNFEIFLRKSVNAGDIFGSTVNYSHSTGDSIAPTIAVSPNNF